MELLQIKDLSFRYPNAEQQALNSISLFVERSSFVTIFGKSGCGKTTLLRLLKREIAPHGEMTGEIIYRGADIDNVCERERAFEIGFVGQNPDEQIVTDKVWHELAFGLENLGEDKAVIRRRVGEMASYFGIQNWYHKRTDELSGGQKQLLNLAAVLVMRPKILLLDEPTAQLDPIAAAEFISTLKKLNDEMGITIIMAEHRLEDVFPISDKVICMDGGKVYAEGTPEDVCKSLKGTDIFAGLPSAVRIWSGLDIDCECPITVRQGRDFLLNNFSHKKGQAADTKSSKLGDVILEAKNIWFRYEKELPDVLSGFELSLHEGEIYSILGGNGAGKTTAINVLSAIDKAYRGSVRVYGKKVSEFKRGALYRKIIAMLPQDPQNVFLKNTVREDLEDMLKVMDIPKAEHDELINRQAKELGIMGLLERHPYDLSGGEQQKCAIAKLLLTEPKILMLDEPTKGLDAYSKEQLGELMVKLKNAGKSVLMVTHDVEFAARYSDRCGLLFDGEIISEESPSEFFSDNSFYTTAASRISRDILKNAVLCEQVTELCKG